LKAASDSSFISVKVQQMVEYLVAIFEGFETNMMAKLDSIASRSDTNQAKTDVDHEEMMAIMEATQERVISPDRRQARTEEGLSRNTGRGGARINGRQN
jgi:hypothetical protein